ncbi:MAG: PipA/GogA/GtgA family type III secretion system effector [Janthinobacterium lividum]
MPATRNVTAAPAAIPAAWTAAWAATWDRLTLSERADLAEAVARSWRQGGAIEDTLMAVEEETHARTLQWLRLPVDRVGAQDNTPPAQDPGPGRRADEVDLYWALHAREQAGAEDAARTAERLAAHPALLPLTNEEEYFYQTNRLADLFDLDWLRHPPRSNLALLRAVHAALHVRFPDYRAPLLDQHAIAVAWQLRQRRDTRPGEAETQEAIETFGQELQTEIQAETLAARLIPASNAPQPYGCAWFDGIAVRDALGKSVADLAGDLIRHEPDVIHLIKEQSGQARGDARHVFPSRRAGSDPRQLFETWLRKRLDDLLESARFPFGTPAQSIDTILLRLSGAHGLRLSPGDDFATVMRDFNRLCAAWRAAPGYWISPTLAAAIHLAHATGDKAALLAMAAGRRENQAIDLFHERLAAYAEPPRDAQARSREWQRLHPPANPANPATPANQTEMLPRPERLAQGAPAHDSLAAAREFVQGLLALPRWPMHVGETLLRGDSREILGLLPFVVPAYDIEEGIRHGNRTRALRGAFQFGADVLMTWIGGRVEASLALPPSLASITGNGERAMLGMLHRGLETLGESRTVSLPLTEWGATEPPRSMATFPDIDVPLRYRPLALRARGGEIVPVELPNVPRAKLVHLPRENRVIPVGASGQVVWELNWDGHIVGAVGDARLGELRQKILEELRPPAGQTDTALIDNGMTVKSMTRWLKTHAGTTPPPEAGSVEYAQTTLRGLIDFNDENREELSVFQELGRLHCQSETFRLLTHRATPREDGKLLQFDIRPGANPAYVAERHVITLPPPTELAEIEYLGATGSVRFDPRDAWLHEFIHAMTQLADPAPAQATAHRGPVVYLTDRILYEIDRRTPERIAYAWSTSHTQQRMAPDLKRLAERVAQENLLLDGQLALEMPIAPDTLVGGTPVAQHATVGAARRIESMVHGTVAAQRSRAPFPERLFDRLHANVFAVGELGGAHLRLVRNFVEHARFIYDNDAWARGFLDAWLDRDTTTHWTIHRLSRILADREGVPCRLNTPYRRIELSYAESFTYLSPTGLKPYTMQRRVATLLAELGLPARTRTTTANLDIDTERGAIVYVENKLLGLAGDNEERRVAARIWRTRPSNPPSADLPVNPTLARRVADDEDRYIASVCTLQPDSTCVCS